MEPKVIISIAVVVVLLAIIVWRNWPQKKEKVKEEVRKDTFE